MTVIYDELGFDRGPRSLPRWVRLLDATALLLLLIAALLIPGDGIRVELGYVRVSITSAVRLLFWAGLVIAARHGLRDGLCRVDADAGGRQLVRE